MKKYVKFALKQFGINPKVRIKLTNSKKYWGCCIPHKDGYIIKVSREAPDRRNVIFHECAHIKQYELDNLYYSDELKMFKGERWAGKEYMWYPWEIEARGLEGALEHAWHTRKKKKKS
jgi:hypothetical protein